MASLTASCTISTPTTWLFDLKYYIIRINRCQFWGIFHNIHISPVQLYQPGWDLWCLFHNRHPQDWFSWSARQYPPPRLAIKLILYAIELIHFCIIAHRFVQKLRAKCVHLEKSLWGYVEGSSHQFLLRCNWLCMYFFYRFFCYGALPGSPRVPRAAQERALEHLLPSWQGRHK